LEKKLQKLKPITRNALVEGVSEDWESFKKLKINSKNLNRYSSSQN